MGNRTVLWIAAGLLFALIVVGLAYMILLATQPSNERLTIPALLSIPTIGASFIYIDCPTCNTNPFDVAECSALLEKWKNDPRIISVAQARVHPVNLSAPGRIEKKVELRYNISSGQSQQNIRCIYWS